MNPVFSVLIGGILPFGSVFIELFFILTSMWLQQVLRMHSCSIIAKFDGCLCDRLLVRECLPCLDNIVARGCLPSLGASTNSTAKSMLCFVSAVLLPVRIPIPGVHHPHHHLRGDHDRALLFPALLRGLQLVVRATQPIPNHARHGLICCASNPASCVRIICHTVRYHPCSSACTLLAGGGHTLRVARQPCICSYTGQPTFVCSPRHIDADTKQMDWVIHQESCTPNMQCECGAKLDGATHHEDHSTT